MRIRPTLPDVGKIGVRPGKSLGRNRRSVRHDVLPLALDNQPVGLGLAMKVEVEGGALVGMAQIEVAARQRKLVALCRPGGDDFAGGSNDAAAADLVDLKADAADCG
jgi:hypothetical protein